MTVSKDWRFIEEVQKEAEDGRLEAREWKLKYYAARDGHRSLERGMKRLQGKLRTRDAYIRAAEDFFAAMRQEGRPGAVEFLDFFEKNISLQTMRHRVGAAKKPIPAWVKLADREAKR